MSEVRLFPNWSLAKAAGQLLRPLAFVAISSACGRCVYANERIPGAYRGHIVADHKILLQNLPSPEAKKVLLYTFDRFGRAKVSLNLDTAGTFQWSFDDGDEQDRTDLSGTWKKDGKRIVLFPKGEKSMTLKVKGRKLVGQFLTAKGYSVEYSRT